MMGQEVTCSAQKSGLDPRIFSTNSCSHPCPRAPAKHGASIAQDVAYCLETTSLHSDNKFLASPEAKLYPQ